jgi:hypothetical protein
MIDQMELGFSARHNRRRNQKGLERQRRAQWWFARMRGVVNGALEWHGAPPARPEQVYMPLGSSRF